MSDDPASPCIVVLAGTNGAGKSSIAGATLRASGGEYFNPDEAARSLRQRNPGLSQFKANVAAWRHGRRLLERAIEERKNYYFETTLGGRTITALLEKSIDKGFDVRVWYVGLRSPELHIERVAARVARGGHDIPEETIRLRYDKSRTNLIRLLPGLAELKLYDNSEHGSPHDGDAPTPTLVAHVQHGRIVAPMDLAATPDWAKPIVAAAMKLGAEE